MRSNEVLFMFKNDKKLNNYFLASRQKSGFTLIEIMVSVAIFTIVALAISGAFVTLANIFRKVQTSRAVIDNINLAVDLMALQVREGQNYNFSDGTVFDADCSSLSDGRDCFTKITFDEYVIDNFNYIPNRRIGYELAESADEKGYIRQCVRDLDITGVPVGSESCSQLTSDEVDIHFLRFYANDILLSAEPVTISIDGTAFNPRGLESDFTLQTSLVRRNYRN